MTQNGKAFLPPVREQLRDRFRQNVEDRYDTARGHYGHEVERALEEYLEASFEGGDLHDELRRIRTTVNEIRDSLENESEGGIDSVSNTTEERIREIMSDIEEHAEELGANRVNEDVVESAIEKNAGHSYKTIKRYMKLLQNQRNLFPHPKKDHVYFVSPKAFVVYCENNVPTDKCDELLELYGFEWWNEALPDELREQGRGFQ